MTRCASQPLTTPLPTLLSALDRIPLDPPTRALAQKLAKTCVEEGQVLTAHELAAVAQMEGTMPQMDAIASQAALDRQLSPGWNRPVSASARSQEFRRLKKGCTVFKGFVFGGAGLFLIALMIMSIVDVHTHGVFKGIAGVASVLGYFSLMGFSGPAEKLAQPFGPHSRGESLFARVGDIPSVPNVCEKTCARRVAPDAGGRRRSRPLGRR